MTILNKHSDLIMHYIHDHVYINANHCFKGSSNIVKYMPSD